MTKGVRPSLATFSSLLFSVLAHGGAQQARRATTATDIAVSAFEARLSLPASFPIVKDLRSLHMRLERLPCYGPCPVYSVEVHGNGDVFYNGSSGTLLIIGHHRDRISRKAVERLVDSFHEADYFSLADKYETTSTDLPTFITSIAFDGHRKSVVDYGGRAVGMPKTLSRLEDQLDEIAHTDTWIKGTSETTRSLLREHWRFKEATSDNYKLFAAAIIDPSILRLYLEHGFPRLRSSNLEDSPVVSASSYGNPALLERLLRNHQQISAAILTKALSAAAAVGDISTMRFLIALGARVDSPVAERNEFSPPLLSAVYSGKAAAVDELLKFHPNVNATNNNGEDAVALLLTRALDQSENVQILQSLIKAGIKLDLHDSLTGETAIFKASQVPNSVDVLHLLVKGGADVNAHNDFGQTPLMNCFDTDYARALITLGADVQVRDNQGNTAAQKARDMGDHELADLLEREELKRRKQASR